MRKLIQITDRFLLWFDRQDKVYFILIGFYSGVVLTLWFFVKLVNYDSWNEISKAICTKSEVFSMISGIIATIISVSIPIANQTVSDQLKEYYHPAIVGIFHRERSFKVQSINAITLFALTLFLTLWEKETPSLIRTFLTLITVFIYVWAIFWFFIFINRVREYVVDTETQVINHLKKGITNEIS